MSDKISARVDVVSEEKEPPSRSTREFYKQFFPNSTKEDWLDWKWQIKNRITTREKLEEIFCLTDDEKKVLSIHRENLPLAITPYYASLISKSADDPIRKCVIPQINETIVAAEEAEDPLGEDHQSPVSCIVHRYPDRVLFLSTKFCSVNCRFCTRSRIVGEHKCFSSGIKEWEKGFDYIRNHTEIRDVLISGGDPLTLSTKSLEFIVSSIRSIKHVEMIRIGTKIPAVLPQRVTKELCDMLKKYHPIYMSVHFTHPVELTEESMKACNMLSDAGIPLGSQTVLLKGINDKPDTMRKLFTGLLMARVRPYYMYQCDLIVGSSHFRTPIQSGLDIIQNLRGWTSGYAVPQFIIDSPNGGGKIPILPEYVQGYDENQNLILKNYKGELYKYPDVFKD